MFLSNELGLSGLYPEHIETNAAATLEDLAVGWTLTHIQLDVCANVPDASQARFIGSAAGKKKCPVARLLNTNISITASLTHGLKRVQKPSEVNARRRCNETNQDG